MMIRTVKDLKALLEGLDDNMQVNGTNSNGDFVYVSAYSELQDMEEEEIEEAKECEPGWEASLIVNVGN